MGKAIYNSSLTTNKTNWVVWSGGYDSTLILYDILKEHGCCHTLYFDLKGISKEKRILELSYRKKFIEFAKKKNWNIIDNIIKIDYGKLYADNLLPQQTFWMLNSLWFVPDNATISFGFHRGDDFWHQCSKYESMGQTILEALNKKIWINFPLKWKDKHSIIADIRNNKLEKYVWTCECPTEKNKACGYCRPCKLLKMCNLYLKDDSERLTI